MHYNQDKMYSRCIISDYILSLLSMEEEMLLCRMAKERQMEESFRSAIRTGLQEIQKKYGPSWFTDYETEFLIKLGTLTNTDNSRGN
jgi:hypothetical protein